MPVTDTSPAVAALQIELYRKLTSSQRAQIAVNLSEAVRQTAIAGIRRRHPEYTEAEVARELRRILYG